jgi:hypothetical protein
MANASGTDKRLAGGPARVQSVGMRLRFRRRWVALTLFLAWLVWDQAFQPILNLNIERWAEKEGADRLLVERAPGLMSALDYILSEYVAPFLAFILGDFGFGFVTGALLFSLVDWPAVASWIKRRRTESKVTPPSIADSDFMIRAAKASDVTFEHALITGVDQLADLSDSKLTIRGSHLRGPREPAEAEYQAFLIEISRMADILTWRILQAQNRDQLNNPAIAAFMSRIQQRHGKTAFDAEIHDVIARFLSVCNAILSHNGKDVTLVNFMKGDLIGYLAKFQGIILSRF